MQRFVNDQTVAGVVTLVARHDRVLHLDAEGWADLANRRPLGMKDTTFWPTPAQAKRLAKAYQPRREGSGLEETGIFFLSGDLSDRRRAPRPAGGLFSTAADVARLYQMMLNGGSGAGNGCSRRNRWRN